MQNLHSLYKYSIFQSELYCTLQAWVKYVEYLYLVVFKYFFSVFVFVFVFER